MNIFFLDDEITKNAQSLCDKHVVKMILETAQLLCSAHQNAPYKPTHKNHPCAIWTRASKANYEWLIKYGLALAEEFEFRYNKPHKSKLVIEWCALNIDSVIFASNELTPMPQVVPENCKKESVIEAYREYYKTSKKDFAKWNRGRMPPSWWS